MQPNPAWPSTTSCRIPAPHGQPWRDAKRLSIQAKGVRIIPEANRSSDKAPSHRVYRNGAQIGAAWSKRSGEGRDYLSITLDDPSFPAPVHANLFSDEDGQGFTLLWSRGRRRNGD